MGFDAYIWVDLEFPSDPKDCMNRWKQSPLDGARWSDWGEFGAAAGPVKGFETVAAVLAQAARYAARERLEGRLCVFSVALGPTQVKVRALLDKSQTDWWRTFAVMARAAAPLDAVGEFGWATHDGAWDCYVAAIGEGQSQFRKMGPEELRRLDRHPAVAELDAKKAALPATAPAPVKLQAPTPRPPGSGRGYRRRGYGGHAPRPSPVVVHDEVPPDEVPPDEEAIAAVGALDDDGVAGVDLDTATDTGLDADPDADTGADEDGAADDAGDDEAPARPAAPAPRAHAARPGRPAGAKPTPAKAPAAEKAAKAPAAEKAAKAPAAEKAAKAPAAEKAAKAPAAEKAAKAPAAEKAAKAPAAEKAAKAPAAKAAAEKAPAKLAPAKPAPVKKKPPRAK